MGAIYDALVDIGAIHLGEHFIYTSGVHVERYHNVRWAASNGEVMSQLAAYLAEDLWDKDFDGIIGPETLGRTLADRVAQLLWDSHLAPVVAPETIWCRIIKQADGSRQVELPDEEKFGFGRLLQPGSTWWLIDDVLSKGTTLETLIDFVQACGATVSGASVGLRLNQSITAKRLGIPALYFAEDVTDVEMLSEAECQERGMCSRRVPIVRKPGHGHEYELAHPDYPGGYIDSPR